MQAARVRATGPEPGEGFTGHLREEVGGGPGSRRFLRRLLLFGKGAFVVGHFALEVVPDEVVGVAGSHTSSPFGIIPVPWRRALGVGRWLRGARLR